jgi:hypothetical protein
MRLEAQIMYSEGDQKNAVVIGSGASTIQVDWIASQKRGDSLMPMESRWLELFAMKIGPL